ncbi:MAG: DUF2970 domain-containing protein [Pseudomonadales bacterium]|nr:DUF2970 domain-containing protein [Pseudomonadales bacterium]
MKDNNQPKQPQKKPGFLQVLGSVLAAIFGVQSAKNRERDFTQGNFKDYIAVYVVIVVFIVIGMITLVRMVLSQTGAY